MWARQKKEKRGRNCWQKMFFLENNIEKKIVNKIRIFSLKKPTGKKWAEKKGLLEKKLWAGCGR